MSHLQLGFARFDQPLALLLLTLVPLAIVGYVVSLRRRKVRAMAFSAVDVLTTVSTRSTRRHIPFLVTLLSATLLVLTVADPQVQGAVTSQRKTVMLVVDISRSMAATDVAPTRLKAAQEAASRFVDRIPAGYEIGLVVFSGVARVASTPTMDRERVQKGLARLELENGTATGDALVLALSQFGESTRGGVVVLISDGRQTAGNVTVDSAAGALKAADVTVFAVALGTAQGQISEINAMDNSTSLIGVPPDPVSLNLLTTVTGGKTFEAVTVPQLNQIYDAVGGQLSTQAGWVGVGWLTALAALLLLGLAAMASLRWSAIP